jgi:uncharacterized protein (TIGR02301 family)
MTLALLAASIIAVTGLPARTAAERQLLDQLAFTLGQVHALHRVCAGPDDDTWRGRMARLMEIEAVSETRKAELTARFNAGFAAEGAKARSCTAARTEEAKLSQYGADLARKLGHSAS